MKHVAFVGNCQSLSLRDSIAALLPSCEITRFDLSVMGILEFIERSLPTLGDYDLVIAPDFGEESGPIAPERLRARARSFLLMPSVVFWGFHPDVTYLPQKYLHAYSPVGSYHSILTIAGFVSGRCPRETAALFNPLVYGRAGYFAAYQREVAALERAFARAGVDVLPLFERWREGGCFMHSPNHPRVHVLHDVARAVLAAAGLPIDETADLSDMPDVLERFPAMPVYPEIAARIGVPGSLDFRLEQRAGLPAATIGLEALIAGSFDRYATIPVSALRSAIGVERALRALTP